jgi:4-hydroxy-2-oxoheptanedioate aldolase
MMDYADYIKQANQERFVVLQIEDPEPLDDLESIAALDGIDMLFFGPADFSHGIGAPGDWNHPKLLETRKRVAQVAVEHGKYAGTPASMETIDELIDMGYKFFPIGADVITVGRYCKQLMEGFLKIVNK